MCQNGPAEMVTRQSFLNSFVCLEGAGQLVSSGYWKKAKFGIGQVGTGLGNRTRKSRVVTSVLLGQINSSSSKTKIGSIVYSCNYATQIARECFIPTLIWKTVCFIC